MVKQAVKEAGKQDLKWTKDLRQRLENFGWGTTPEELEEFSKAQLREILECMEKGKGTLGPRAAGESKARGVEVDCIVKGLEGRSADRPCEECRGNDVEDADHFLLKCARWQEERKEL